MLGLISCSGSKDPAPQTSEQTSPEPAPSEASKADGPSIQLKRDLIIGQDPDGVLLGANAVVTEHTNGKIYVLDPDNFRVVILNNDGSLDKEFGNEGQGPGEFQKPQGIAVNAEGNIAVGDPTARVIHAFDPAGTYIDAKRLSVNTPQILGGPYYFSDGKVALHLVTMDQNFQLSYNLSIYDAELTLVKEIYSSPTPPLDWNKASEPGFWVDFLKGQFEEIGRGFAFGAIANDRMFFSRGDSFDVKIFDNGGVETKQFTIDTQPIPFTEASQRELYGQVYESMLADPMLSNNLNQATFERAMNEVEEVEVAPRVAGIAPAGKGFAVFYNHDYAKVTTKIAFYDYDGELLGKADYNGPVTYLTGTETHIYAVGLDESDNVVIHRYSIEGL
jgi:hypothetical protein